MFGPHVDDVKGRAKRTTETVGLGSKSQSSNDSVKFELILEGCMETMTQRSIL